MILSKSLNKEKQYLCEICTNIIEEIPRAVSCCLCKFIAHKKCIKKHRGKFMLNDIKNEYPMCIDCKENTLPFQKRVKEKSSELKNNSNLKNFFNTINANNLENINNKAVNEISPLNCKYVDYDSFNHLYDEKDLSLLHMNIASLGKHKEEFETSLQILNYDFGIIGLSETKIIRNICPNFDKSLPGYKYFDTSTESSMGGTILYVNNKFNSVPRNDLEIVMYKSKELESSFVELINQGKKNIVIGCIYRHPCMNLSDFNSNYLKNILDKLSIENKNVYLLGDFNVDLMNIENNPIISNYFDIFSSHCFIPHILYPTRVAHKISQDITTKTLIDNIFSNSINYAAGVSGNITFAISDHLAQFLIIPIDFDKKSL